MTITTEKDYNNFDFWCGASDTVEELTMEEVKTIWDMLEESYSIDGMIPSETDINDFFWFERDLIAEWLGYNDFEEIMERNALI